MNKIIAVIFLLVSFVSLAQVPQKLSYQAVVRNQQGKLVCDQQVGVLFTIHQGSETGNVVFTQDFITSTNSNGLVTLEIGNTAEFTSIDWSNEPFFITTEFDPSGGTSYSITSTSQLMSVPYALHSATAEMAMHIPQLTLHNKYLICSRR